MHIDARTLENNSIIEGDLCIIGAGAAGITLAMEMMSTNYKVILLEGGGFDYEPAMQDLYRGKNIGLPYYTLESSRLHFFGGSTGHWAGFCSSLDPIDFEKRKWVPESGWPIRYADMQKYYAPAHKIVELPPFDYTTGDETGDDPTYKPLAFDKSKVWNKIWHFSTPTRFGKKYRESILSAPNVHLYTYANVTEIVPAVNTNAIDHVVVKNLAGKSHIVKAKRFVLACCAIQNARLLLCSRSRSSNGLGNDNDLVGRYFMEHLEVNCADLYLSKAEAFDLYRLQYFHTKRRAELALTPAMQQKLEILNGTVALNPVENSNDEQSVESSTSVDTSTPAPDASMRGWENSEEYFKSGKYPKEKFKRARQFEFFVRMEQAPNAASRITLDREVDALGVPRVILDWRMTALEKKSLRKLSEVLGQQLGAAQIGRVRLRDWLRDEKDANWPDSLAGGWHHMGTTKMSSDPKQGVVDANCKVHGIPNLYIAGSSCFPTGGAANPTLSLIALTLRLADHLKGG